MVTIARSLASSFKSLLTALSTRLAALVGSKRARRNPPDQLPPLGRAPDARDALVASKRKSTEMAMQTLRSSLKAGKITQAEYSARVAELSSIHVA